MLTQKDIEQVEQKGIPIPEIQRQLEISEKEFLF